MTEFLHWLEVLYSGVEFSFPRQCSILIDDITHTISRKVSWFSPRNVPAIFNLETREWYFYSIERYPDTHHIDFEE